MDFPLIPWLLANTAMVNSAPGGNITGESIDGLKVLDENPAASPGFSDVTADLICDLSQSATPINLLRHLAQIAADHVLTPQDLLAIFRRSVSPLWPVTL